MTDSYRYNLSETKRKARGRWLDILPVMNNGFAAAAARPGFHVPCPVHGGVDGFRLFMDAAISGGGICNSCGTFPDGFALLQWANDCTLPWSVKQVAEYLEGSPVAVVDAARQTKRERTPEQQAARLLAIGKILERCSHEPGAAHRAYFENRGIPGAADLRSPSLLYHPGLPYYVKGKPLKGDGGTWLTWPAIIGRVSSAAGWLGLQRVYLTKDGKKADTEICQAARAVGIDDEIDCKPMLAVNRMNGGAVRLGKAGRVLAVGEGLETVLSVSVALGGSMSVAAAGTAALLEQMDIPEQVERLLIFADKDKSGRGQSAAESLYQRERHNREVEILLPDMAIPENKKGIDWLDVLTSNCVPLYHQSFKAIIGGTHKS